MPATLTRTYAHTLASPIGDITLLSDGEYLTGLHLGHAPPVDAVRDPAPLTEAVAQLRAYLAGELREFDLLLQQPGTAFQQKVWAELTAIPYGETISYAELAVRVGQPTAARAVGSANGKNHIAVIVPCHRVIAAGGTLGGYGGGLWRKEWLLRHEGAAGW